MSDNLLAGVVTAVAIAPLCATCILGPAFLASFFTGITAWFGGFDRVATVAMSLVASLAVYGLIRMRGARRALAEPAGEASQ